MKVAINGCFGGYSLSQAAYKKLIEYGVPVYDYVQPKTDPKTGHWEKEEEHEGRYIYRGGLGWGPEDQLWDSWTRDYDTRTDPLIIRVIEELGKAANGDCADIKIVEIPDGVDFEIDEYDGNESIHETHRSWY